MTHDSDRQQVYQRLLDAYGAQGWWPASTDFELLVGAILVQNTRWENVELAIQNLARVGLLKPEALLRAPFDLISECIRPAGFHRIKTQRVKALTEWFEGNHQRLMGLDRSALRRDLLAQVGIGPETADVLCMYLYRQSAVIADSYTRRICFRLGWLDAPAEISYARAAAQLNWMLDWPPVELSEFHALLVAHAKARCRKRPRCSECVLRGTCRFGLVSASGCLSDSPG